jgi:hypothetical protein
MPQIRHSLFTPAEKGKEKDSSEHFDAPDDLSNGMILTLLRNLSPSAPETKVSTLSTSSKPRLVKLAIVAKGERAFSFGGSTRKAVDFDIKVEIDAVAVCGGPDYLGNSHQDNHVWMSTGTIPTFVRFEGPPYEGGPIWRTLPL